MTASKPAHEPRLARVAAMIADPSRSRMLSYLLSGEFASAGELARVASVSAATASGHLSKLLDGGLLECEARGRHRYFRLASPEVAHALEALALVAERGEHDRSWAAPARQSLRLARCCYGHLAGELGVKLFDSLHACEGLQSNSEGYELTARGQAWLGEMGMPTITPQGRRRFAYACLDWSERRDHLAGQLADEICQHLIAQAWLQRTESRALALTPTGVQQLLPRLAGKAAGKT